MVLAIGTALRAVGKVQSMKKIKYDYWQSFRVLPALRVGWVLYAQELPVVWWAKYCAYRPDYGSRAVLSTARRAGAK